MQGAKTIAWRPWDAAAFEQSRAQRRPLLIRLTATWCGTCRAQEEGADADARVVEAVSARFVPVRIDVDRRPDLRARYAMGSLPTTAVVAGDGRVLLGATALRADDFLRLLEAGLAASRNVPGSPEPAAVEGPSPPASDLGGALEQSVRSVLDSYDWPNHGFGVGPRFPQPQAALLLMAAGLRMAIPFAQKAALLTLSAMPKTEIYDPVDGGFFRYCESPNWQAPHHEKLLEANAQLLAAYAAVAAWAGREEDRRVARDVAAYLDRSLAIPSRSLWGGSQAGDEDYYARMAHARKSRGPPAVDPTIFADANARTISAFAAAGACLKDPRLSARAGIALAELIDSGAAKDDDVFHFQDREGWRASGLLGDVVTVATAALDVFCTTGQPKWLEVASRIASRIEPQFAHPEAASLVGRRRGRSHPDEPALSPDKPVAANAEAATLFLRLAASTGERALRELALRILGSLRPLVGELGPSGAPLGIALLAAHLGVVVVEATAAPRPQAHPALFQDAIACSMALGPVTLRIARHDGSGEDRPRVHYARDDKRSEGVVDAGKLPRALRSIVAITDSI